MSIDGIGLRKNPSIKKLVSCTLCLSGFVEVLATQYNAQFTHKISPLPTFFYLSGFQAWFKPVSSQLSPGLGTIFLYGFWLHGWRTPVLFSPRPKTGPND